MIKQFLGTAVTWVRAFTGPCLILGGAVALIAGAGAFTLAWKLQAGNIAEQKARYAERETAIANERADSMARINWLSGQVLAERDQRREQIDSIAADLSRVAAGVSTCARKSDVRISVTPAGVIEATPNGQLRDLAEAVRDFAVACAIGRDRDANEHNALIDWIEKAVAPPR